MTCRLARTAGWPPSLPYILSAARITHYLRAILRDKIASFMSRGECERTLQAWLDSYVAGDDEATWADKARRPLREGLVNVEDTPGKPGLYRAVVFLSSAVPARRALRVHARRRRSSAGRDVSDCGPGTSVSTAVRSRRDR